ncbi:protein kintoun [Rhynchocyon petersi]
MAQMTTSSMLEDLDLSGDEVTRFTSAFQDPEFRRLFAKYAEELTDPENRRRYEAEIIALERERGVEVRFVHPQPGHVLSTSLDGARRCFVNVCSNVLVGAPSSRPASAAQAPGNHWSLPHSLAPGREYAGRRGTFYTVYDVVFHPDTLALARRQEGFLHMLNSTALEAVEKQFGVKLDRRNAKTLKIKYKGTPEAAVLRTPLPGGPRARADEESGPLPDFPYPYQYPAAAGNSAVPQLDKPSPPETAPAPTEPRYSVVQRHHVDLQDYRCSRDSAPSTVPSELVVTIELPLLRSAEQAALEVTGRLLCLDSRKPDYRLRLSLPYPVDDSRGKAQFNKARRQLVVTLPVDLSLARLQPSAAPEDRVHPAGTDGVAGAPAFQRGAGPTSGHREDRDSSPNRTRAADPGVVLSSAPEAAPPPAGAEEELVPEPEEQDLEEHVGPPPPGAGSSSGDSGRGAPGALSEDRVTESSPVERCAGRDLNMEMRLDSEGTSWERTGEAMDEFGTESGECLCPPLQCNQDEETLTLLIQVPRILPQSLKGDLNPLRYKLCFSTQDFVRYSFFLQFAPGNKLSAKEPVISISSNNAVIELAKSPESRGHWRQWYYGLNIDSLEEKLFVNEENVNEFLDDILSSASKQAISLTPPLIEVIQITDNNIHIHTKLQECSKSDQLDVKEGVQEGRSHLTQKDKTEPLTTTTVNQKEKREHLTTIGEPEHTLGNSRLSDSSIADNALATDSGSVTYLQRKPLDVSQVLSSKAPQSESKLEPEFIKEKCSVYTNEGKQNVKEPVLTGKKELDGGHLSSLQNKTTVHHLSDFESIKETNMQDGSVQIIKDHVTHCTFSFQNSLLYDLD